MNRQKFSTLMSAYPLKGQDIVPLTQVTNAGVKVSTQTTLADILAYVSMDLTFESINEGLAATVDGQYFKVATSGNTIEIYRNDGGYATRIQDELSNSVKEVADLAAKVEEMTGQVDLALEQSKAASELAAKAAEDAAKAAESARESAKVAEENAQEILDASKEAIEAAKEAKINADKASASADRVLAVEETINKVNDTITQLLGLYTIADLGEVSKASINPDVAGMVRFSVAPGMLDCEVHIGDMNNQSGIYRQLTLYITNDPNANLIWGSNVMWSNGREPRFSAATGSIDIVTLITIDNGKNWFAMYNGGWFNVQ